MVHNLGLKEDRRKQLLIFTEHKDTLDYLVENLSADFEVAQIHGQMKLAERIEQERYFRETAQIMVATEAAGEGINLQFCHLMVNYDIPWNPNRLEQRMGRIHRIGQTDEVYIFNLVATSTREGYVLNVLLKKMENMGIALGDKVFDVVGQAIGTNLREVLEAVIAGEMTKEAAAATLRRRGGRPGHQGAGRGTAGERARPPPPGLGDRTGPGRACRGTPAPAAATSSASSKTPSPTRAGRSPSASTRAPGGSTARRTSWSPRAAPRRDCAGSPLSTSGSPSTSPSPPARVSARKTRRCPPPSCAGQATRCSTRWSATSIERTAAEVAKGAVFFDPDIDEPVVLRFLIGDVVDGNGEIVRRTLAAARVFPDGRTVTRARRVAVRRRSPDRQMQPARRAGHPGGRAGRPRPGDVGAAAPVRACLPGRQGRTRPRRRHPGGLPQAVVQRPDRPGRRRHLRRRRREGPRRPRRRRPPPQGRDSPRPSTRSGAASAWKKPSVAAPSSAAT